jgi:hypothetical protein
MGYILGRLLHALDSGRDNVHNNLKYSACIRRFVPRYAFWESLSVPLSMRARDGKNKLRDIADRQAAL